PPRLLLRATFLHFVPAVATRLSFPSCRRGERPDKRQAQVEKCFPATHTAAGCGAAANRAGAPPAEPPPDDPTATSEAHHIATRKQCPSLQPLCRNRAA